MQQKPEIWRYDTSCTVDFSVLKVSQNTVWCITNHWSEHRAFFLPTTIYQRVQEFHNKNCDIGQGYIFGDCKLNVFQVGFLILVNTSTRSTQGFTNQFLL